MSTLVERPSARALALGAGVTAPARAPRASRPLAGVGIAGTIALALALIAFVAAGGLRLERTTYVELGLMLAGALLCAGALVAPRARVARLHGGLALLALALLAAYTALSILWSLTPSESWVEANRTFAYLAAFAGTMALARLAPGRWGALLGGLALGCVAICGWALTTKVFPGALSPDETYARLRAPFDYWNAVGLMAALGVLPLLWLGARRSGRAAANALAWPGIALLEVCLMLSYSRGALLALAVGLAFWFAAVPLRLRGAVVLLGATAGALPVIAWAFSMSTLTTDRLPADVRADAGHELGILFVVMMLVLGGVGLVCGFLAAERPASPEAKRLAGRGLLGMLVAIPVIAFVALALAPGGVQGQLTDGWRQLTDPDASTPDNTPGRLTQASSVRARYWDEAFAVHGVSPWVGTGAGAYGTVRTRFRTGTLFVRHAHGYVPQTLADLGWLGLGLSLLLLGLWGWAVARALGLRRRDRGLPWDAERVGMATLVAVALVFGVHSAVDWTWFIPANAVAGLMAAAWVVSRPPLRERLGLVAADQPPAAFPAGDGAPASDGEAGPLTAKGGDSAAPTPQAGPLVAAGGAYAVPRHAPAAGPLWGPAPPPPEQPPPAADVAGPGGRPISDADWRRRPPFPWAGAAAGLIVVALALAAGWAAYQPVRAVHAGDVAVARLERGELDAAVEIARIARDRNPLSPEPLWELAYIEERRGRPANAEEALERAVQLQPASAEAWRRLGRLQLSTLNQPARAVRSFRAAYFLDPRNPASTSDLIEAERANGAPPPP